MELEIGKELRMAVKLVQQKVYEWEGWMGIRWAVLFVPTEQQDFPFGLFRRGIHTLIFATSSLDSVNVVSNLCFEYSFSPFTTFVLVTI